MKAKGIPGINIQWPWSELLLSGQKSIETRTYPIPKKFIGVELAVIETPGPQGRRKAGIEKARIIGTITFDSYIKYETKMDWAKDAKRHCVKVDDPLYAWHSDRPKFGWVVKDFRKFDKPCPSPKTRGIIFARGCKISR
jgi:hypothetical protein